MNTVFSHFDERLTRSLSGALDDAHDPAQARPRLLVVDDQPANVQALYRTFADECQVFMATGGEQALTLAESKQPDLVLLDVEMPGLGGHEVCARLRANAATRHIPVIFVTAHTHVEDERLGLDLGAVDFIAKPINPTIVRARVRTHLKLKRQSDLLRSWVYIDGLTGVANRRYFEDRLASEWRRSQRDGTPLSVALIDVDFFKKYNDGFGHLMGDECLCRIAKALKTAGRRPGDMLARYGGEEFVLVLPDTDSSGAREVSERVHRGVVQLGIIHATDAVAPYVTVSMGIATKPAGVDTPAEPLVDLADRLLYQAKSQGRNRTAYGEAMASEGLPKGGAGVVEAVEVGAIGGAG